jgi:hypothetical protein
MRVSSSKHRRSTTMMVPLLFQPHWQMSRLSKMVYDDWIRIDDDYELGVPKMPFH